MQGCIFFESQAETENVGPSEALDKRIQAQIDHKFLGTKRERKDCRWRTKFKLFIQPGYVEFRKVYIFIHIN